MKALKIWFGFFLFLCTPCLLFASYETDQESCFGIGHTPLDISQYGADLGVHWSRLPIDVTGSNYSTVVCDSNLQLLQAANVVPYGIINPSNVGNQSFPTADQFAQAVTRLVERYDGDGVDDMSGLTHPILVWEFLNEYSSAGTPAYPTASFTQSDFIEMIQQGYEAMIAACPDCRLAYDPFNDDDATALLQVFPAANISIIAYHTYAPLDYPSYSGDSYYVLNFEQFLQNLGLGGKEIWVTEYAFYDHQGMVRPTGTIPGTQEDNARWWVQTTGWGFGTGLFSKVIYTEITPPAAASDDPVLGWMTLLDTSDNKRQIYYGMKKMIELIDGYQSVTQLDIATGVYAFKFVMGDCNTYLLWGKENTGFQDTVTLSGLLADQVTIISSVPDSTGSFETSSQTVSGGTISLSLTQSPVYVQEDLMAPAVTTQPATNVTATTATLNGAVNPNGSSTTCYFEYGATTSYGSTTTSQSAGSGTDNVTVTANLTGLAQNTTYHFRLVACSIAGTSYGTDQTFATAAATADHQTFIEQQYRDFLDREGDSGGIAYWVAELNAGGISRSQVIECFYNSAEFQENIAPLARLYFAYFNRIPDYGGLQYWIGQYKAGMSLCGISESFAASSEFTSTYGSLSDDQFVALVYQNVLGRDPDAGGLSYWLAELAGGMTRGGMMTGFSESAEYKELIGNEVQVTMMYISMLRRAPDQGGFDYWVNDMNAGASILDLINGFLCSDEYCSRTSICGL